MRIGTRWSLLLRVGTGEALWKMRTCIVLSRRMNSFIQFMSSSSNNNNNNMRREMEYSSCLGNFLYQSSFKYRKQQIIEITQEQRVLWDATFSRQDYTIQYSSFDSLALRSWNYYIIIKLNSKLMSQIPLLSASFQHKLFLKAIPRWFGAFSWFLYYYYSWFLYYYYYYYIL